MRDIFFALSVFMMAFGVLMMLRNEWVFRQRTRVIVEHFARLSLGMPTYADYISYNDMMRRFWVWDIEKMRRK